MIAKKIKDRQQQSGGGIVAMVNYVARLNKGQDTEDVKFINISNCSFDDVNLAKKEIANTSALNTRAKGSKAYHLVLSFHKQDNLTKEQLLKIEQEFCKKLGYSEHQRVSAFHINTEHPHLHIVINKIHPIKLTCITPKKDFYILAETKKEIEKIYNLTIDNSIDISKNKPTIKENIANVERNSNQLSFYSWVVKNVKPDIENHINNSKNLDDLQETLKGYNLKFKLRGNGLILVDCDNLKYIIKASDVSKNLTKTQLIKKFGAFYIKENLVTPTLSRYQLKPKFNTYKLFSKYSEYKKNIDKEKKLKFEQILTTFKNQLNLLKQHKNTQRNNIKLSVDFSKKTKFELFVSLENEVIKKRIRVKQEKLEAIQHLNSNFKKLTFNDWLIMEAEKGNKEAQKQLAAQINGDTNAGSYITNSKITSNLFNLWEQHKQNIAQARVDKSLETKEKIKQLRNFINDHHRKHTSNILNNSSFSKINKQILVANLKKQCLLKYEIDKNRILQENKPSNSRGLSFTDWLLLEISKGNEEAKKYFEKKKFNYQDDSNNFVMCMNESTQTVQRSGKIKHNYKNNIVYDCGDKFELENLNDVSVDFMLALAIQKFGDNLKINSTDEEFKNCILVRAAKNKLNVDFNDEAINKQFEDVKKTINNIKEKEKTKEKLKEAARQEDVEQSKGMEI